MLDYETSNFSYYTSKVARKAYELACQGFVEVKFDVTTTTGLLGLNLMSPLLQVYALWSYSWKLRCAGFSTSF